LRGKSVSDSDGQEETSRYLAERIGTGRVVLGTGEALWEGENRTGQKVGVKEGLGGGGGGGRIW